MSGLAAEFDIVLVYAPSFDDSKVAVGVLREAGITAIPCKSLNALIDNVVSGCGAVVIAEEGLESDHQDYLRQTLEDQETWSDVPVIILGGANTRPSIEAFAKSGNISILERPFSKLTLVRSVQVALRARAKQYQVRNLLHEQQQATVKRDEFFATLSHELRTPLNVILGWLEILRTGKLNESAQSEALEILERNARMQKGLIDDLLDISRIVTGKMFLEVIPIEIGGLVKSITTSYIPRALEKKVDLHLNVPSGIYMVEGDEQRLAQVISNLLTNAIKFTPSGGKVEVALKALKDTYEITVTDNGQGIEPAFLPHIFDRLKQEDMSTTRAHGGLGLGLAIASHIVEEHRGRIVATSEGRGKGAAVKVTLPVLATMSAPSTKVEPISEATGSLRGIRVLVVDDSPDILQLISVWLKKAEVDVKLVSSAQEVLKTIADFKPHVLLSDIGMPEVDGYQLISKIRKLSKEKGGNVPAVALTAYARDEERARALNAGFQMHISKPISSTQLISAVAALVRKPSA